MTYTELASRKTENDFFMSKQNSGYDWVHSRPERGCSPAVVSASILKGASMRITILTLLLCFCLVTVHALDIDMERIKQIESAGDPYAFSNAGARGLFQITGICLREWNQYHRNEVYTLDDLWTPEINRKIAYWYLHVRIPQMLRYYKKPVTIDNLLTAYNAGISYVVNNKPLPKETINYIQKYKQGGVK